MRSENLKRNKNNIVILLFFFSLLSTFYSLLISDAYALDIKRETLENGLTLLVVERHNLPIVMVTVGIKAGSLYEPEGKAGLANLTASLLTSGTKTRTAAQINEGTEFVGASLEASGDDDYVTVNLAVLKKDLNLGFDLLSDVILHPLFLEDEFNKKRERIKGSLKSQEENPSFVASREFKKAVFGNHPYGRLIQGSPETLDRIKRDDIVNFHTSYYSPDNAIMSVVGDITPEEAKALFGKFFAQWRLPTLPTGQAGGQDAERPQAGSKGITLPLSLKPEEVKKRQTVTINKDLTQANIILGHLGISRDNPDYYAVGIMNYILGGGGFSSRLMQNIREDRGLVYDIHSFFAADKYGGSFQVGLQTKNESANAAIKEVLGEIKKIRNAPVSDTELSDAKSFLTGSFPMRIETSSSIAGFLVAVEYYGLGMDYIDKYPLYINSVTKEDVLRVAEKYLDPENFVLVVVADQKKAELKKEFK